MVRSMTGFGRGIYQDDVRTVTVEIKAVNHRYCDIFVKMPRRYSYAEERIKAEIKKDLYRGKIEVSVSVDNFGKSDSDIRLNKELAGRYYEVLKELASEYEFSDGGNITLGMVARMPEVIQGVASEEDEEEMARCILDATDKAVADICTMRETEGAKLAEDILMRGDIIEGIRKQIEERAPMLEQEFADKFRTRINEILEGKVEVPEERVMVEAAVFADKANITEELVRLESHVLQLRNFMTTSESNIGKKVDFLIQEMNREANTIGSKSNDKEITNLMLNLKAEIEKVREQVQNIE